MEFRWSTVWIGAVVFYGVGDALTTAVGHSLPAIAEVGPVSSWAIGSFGLWAVIPLKVVLFGGFYGITVLLPQPHSRGVPLALFVVGLAITLWNSVMIGLSL